MEDYYSILELPQGAGPDEIKSSYRRLAMKWHPDRNPGSKEAEERFKKIAEAYSVLADEDKRRNYDAWRSAGGEDTGRRPEDWNGAAANGPYGPANGAYEGDAAFAAFWQFAQAAAAAGAFRNAAGASGAAGGPAGGDQASGSRGFGFDFGWSNAFSFEQAEDMFMQEMYALASELTMQNVAWKDIAEELERRGCPRDVAATTAKRFEEKRKTLIRARARPYFVRSALEGGAGLLLFGTFAGFGLGILGFIGLIMSLSGGYNLVRALYFLTTGRAPRS